MHCGNCGEQAGVNDRFCGGCGDALVPAISLPVHETALADGPRIPLGGRPASATPAKLLTPDVSVGVFALTMVIYFAAIFGIYYTCFERNVPTALGWALGGGFLWPGLIVGIARLFGAKRVRRNLLIWVPILSILAFIGSWPPHAVPAADRKQLHEAVVLLQAQQIGDAAVTAPPAPQQKSPSSQAGGTQSLAQAVGNIATLMHDQALRNKERQAQMAKLHIETALVPAALVERELIADSRQRLDQYFQIQQEVFADYDATTTAARGELGKLPPRERELALAGMARTQPRVAAAIGNFKHIEQQLRDDFTGILDLAEANLGKTSAKGGQIYLPHGAVQEYQRLFRDVRNLSQQEANAQAELHDIQQESARTLGRLEQETRGS